MNECMQQFIQAVESGQLDPNMTVGELAQQLMAQAQGGQGGGGQPAPEAGLGQVQPQPMA